MGIRPASEADIAPLVNLINSAYRGESGLRGWTTESRLIGGVRIDDEAVRELMAEPGGIILAAFEEEFPERIVGCVNLRMNVPMSGYEPGSTGYIGLLTVDVDQQSKGVGRFLLERAERYAIEIMKAVGIQMYVLSIRNELINWYLRQGYRPTGERVPYPYGSTRFGEPVVEGLEFMILFRPLV